MRASIRWAILVAVSGFCSAQIHAETLSERDLREIVVRQKNIFARAEKEGDHLDEAWLRGELQSVLNSYDILIQKSPDFAAGYASYGLVLAKVGMAREAAAILMKANQLDPEVAVVKNEIARLLAEDGKVVDALPWLTAAADLEPREALYHYHLGKLLAEGRDDLLGTGQFNRAGLDRTMLEAFQRAAALAPENFAYSYRAAEAYYDLAEPKWEDALAAWDALEQKAKPGVEQETIRLHESNVLIKMGRSDEARKKLETVTEAPLQKQKQTLLDALTQAGTK